MNIFKVAKNTMDFQRIRKVIYNNNLIMFEFFYFLQSWYHIATNYS